MKANVSSLKLIKLLVTSLDKPRSQSELTALAVNFSVHEDRFLVRLLVASIDLSVEKSVDPKLKYLIEIFDKLSNKLYFASVICPAIEELFESNKLQLSLQTLLQLYKVLQLSKLQEITLSVALLESTKLHDIALENLRLKVPDFARAYSDTSYQSPSSDGQESNFAETPVHTLYHLLRLVVQGSITLAPELHKSLFASLENDFPKKSCVLSPALYEKESVTLDIVLSANSCPMSEVSLYQLIENLGPSSLHSCDDIIKVLHEYGLQRINERQVALVISRMVNPALPPNVANDVQLQQLGANGGWGSSSLEQGLDASKATSSAEWSPALFVTAVKMAHKSINWIKVVENLDNELFMVRGAESLRSVMSAITAMKLAPSSAGGGGDNSANSGNSWEFFPIDFLLSDWNHKQAQISWIEALIGGWDPRNPTDSFSFAHFPSRLVNTQESKLFDEPQISKPQIATWKCVDLLVCLLRASCCNIPAVVDTVRGLFNFPAKNCPDVLFFTLLHVDVNAAPELSSCQLREMLLDSLIQMFIDNPSATAVLHWAYHFQTPQHQPRILACFANYYMANELEASRIHKLLDGLHILGHKAVQSAASSGQPVAFGLEVVMHGANRDYFNLEKFLNDRIHAEGETFVMDLIAFIEKRVPLYIVGQELPKAHSNKLKHIMSATRLLYETAAHYSVPTRYAIESVLKKVKPLQQYWYQSKGASSLAQPQPQMGASAAAHNPSPVYGQSPQKPPPPVGTGAAAGLDVSGVAGFNQLTGQLQNLNIGASFGIGKQPTTAQLKQQIPGHIGSTSAQQAAYAPGGPRSTVGAGDFLGGASASVPGPVGHQAPQLSGHHPFGQQLNPAAGGLGAQTPLNAPSPITLASGDVASAAGGAAGNVGAASLIMQREFSQEIESETNSYFMKIYNHPGNPVAPIEELLELLKTYKTSTVTKEREVFLCIMRNLLEEYQFFNQYPEKELKTTALLFGGVIHEGLMEGEALGVGLHYILETLKNHNADNATAGGSGSSSHMFVFGLTAVERCKTALFRYPQLCHRLAQLPCFETQFSAQLKECITYGKQEQPSPNAAAMLAQQHQQSQAVFAPQSATNLSSGVQSAGAVAVGSAPTAVGAPSAPGSGSASSAAAAALHISNSVAQAANTQQPCSFSSSANIDILVAHAAAEAESGEMEEPSKALQEKVAFVFNNISQSNVPAKVEELRAVVTSEKFYPWLSRYLVVSRITMEVNFHQLYSCFLDTFDQKPFTQMVLQETIRNIKVLLTSERVVAHNFSDRALLKNLGKWLGIITLAKDQPILQKSLDLRSLLLEAFHRQANEITIVIPFVAKVMESAAKSDVFKPPNPWTMSIMSILCEIHKDPSLKLNLKFEVEMLGKLLTIDIQEVQQTRPCYLHKPETLCKIVQQLAPLPQTTQLQQAQAAVNARPGAAGAPGDPAHPGQGGSDAAAAQLMAVAEIQQQLSSNRAAMALQLQQQQQRQQQQQQQQHGQGATAAAQQQASQQQQAAQNQQQQQAASGANAAAKQPLFAYQEINHLDLRVGLTGKVRDNYSNTLFHQQPNLRLLIKPNIEKTVQDLLQPLIERSVRISVITCEQMIKKDFAMDPEEMRMRQSALNITRHLTATMTLITCKEPLLIACTNSLKNAFMQQNGNNNVTAELLQQVAHGIANDNLELCVAFTQKSAIEKALMEIEKKLTTEFELRRHARNENRRYCDPKVLTYQAERMPEQLRMKVGTVTPKQLVVYEEFGREIPGFANRPMAAIAPSQHPAQQQGTAPNTTGVLDDPRNAQLGVLGGQQLGGGSGSGGSASSATSSDDLGYMYNKMCNELEQHLKACSAQHSNSRLFHNMQSLLDFVILARSSRDNMATVQLLSKTVDSLLNGLLNTTESQEIVMRFRDCHLLVLKALQDPRAYGAMWTNKNVTKALIESREPNKYCVDGIDCLIKTRLVNMQQFDMYLTAAMENGFNYTVVSFAMKLVYKYLFDEATTNALLEAKYADLYSTIEMLIRIGKGSRSPPEELSRLIEMIGSTVDNSVIDRQPGGPIGMMHSGISQAREFDDPPGLKEKTDQLLREWVTMYHSQASGKDSTKAFSTFVTQMHTQGILKTDDLITRFFRICTEVCVDVCYRALNDSSNSPNHSLTRARCYHTLDAFVRLIALLVRHSGDAANTLTKINLLNKVLGLLTGVLLQDHELKNTSFQQLPYHRIFIMLFMELCAPDEVLDGISFQVLTAFSYALHVLRPSKAPGFAYAWLELISNRIFIARMLHLTPQQKAWAMYAQLLIDQFRFLAPFLRNAELSKPVQLLYKGTLRVLLVLLHDFPEFLCDHHYVFADVIPPNCIQMRNLILSAFPRHMRLPDPFTPDLKVDLLPDIKFPPRILHNFGAGIPTVLRKDLDLYLKSRSPVTFLSELRSHLQVSNEPGVRYNVLLMNALVLYVGVSAINAIQSVGKMPSMSTIPHSPHMDVYQNLAVDLDTEGRYLFLNAIANHLRYPNNHTHYFSCVLLYLFAEANSEHIQEQITRVLLERVIVNRPHPWGLLITFIELINNPNFKFWHHEFVRCAPEIEKLFDSVAKSCMQRKENGQQQQQQGAIGPPGATSTGTTGGAVTTSAGTQQAALQQQQPGGATQARPEMGESGNTSSASVVPSAAEQPA
ncbi:CCR4-NOT transcription complex subunit 1-like isoform X2 [Convolutriloba macropyga]|uniref:CCR4-NOT transcription complex subunit 1-like isoform X2 n=1 Tax=Convolutriloba macropyga TaxID=536237 RepID=UPI003F5267F6